MEEIDRAILALKAAVKLSKNNGGVNDAAHDFTLYLVLLRSSSLSSQSTSKICDIFRQSPLPLYAAVPGPALQLSSTILRKIVDNIKTSPFKSQHTPSIISWNEVAIALLSGVLDFLDKQCDDGTKEAVASAFYPTICTLFFYQDWSLALLQRTRVIAFSLLRDTLVNHPGNQRRLRDHAVLGGSLIGIAISQSKDYLVIDALLNLVGLLIPSNKTVEGKDKRAAFIQELFGSVERFSCSCTLVDILQSIEGPFWEDTSMKVMDALAGSDITFPQSFALDEIHVCGKTYPQPTAFDRLYLDRESFLVDVLVQENVYESLTISYSHIRTITMNASNGPPPHKATVRVDLTNPPRVGKAPLNILRGQNLYLHFEIQWEDSRRFIEALQQRGVVQIGISPVKLAGTKRKWDDAESPIRAQKTSEDVRLSRKKARVDTSGKIEAGVIQAVASSEDVKPSKMCFTDVDSLEDDRVGNNAYSLLGDEYIEYSVSLAGSENSILDVSSDSLMIQLTPPGKYPIVIDLTGTPTPTRNGQDSAEEHGARKKSWTVMNVGVQSVESSKASVSDKHLETDDAENLGASNQHFNPSMSVNAVPKPFSAHTYIDLTSDEHHHPEELLPATTDGGRCVLQEELSHLKSQLKQLRGKISKLEQNNSLLQSAANRLSDFYEGWTNLVLLNIVKQPREGVENDDIIYTCEYRYVGTEKKPDPEGTPVQKSLAISFSLRIFTDSEDQETEKMVHYIPLKLPEANDQFNDHLGHLTNEFTFPHKQNSFFMGSIMRQMETAFNLTFGRESEAEELSAGNEPGGGIL